MLYMTMSSGFAMQIHYCMGKKAGVDFYAEENDKCGKCGMKEKKAGCCSNDYKFYKLEDAHKNVSGEYPVFISTALYLNNYQAFVSFPTHFFKCKVNQSNSPPGTSSDVPIIIMNCNFRI